MHPVYPWQLQEWQYLLNCKNSKKLPHALLIKGMEGLGKYRFAKCIAEILLCQNSTIRACGECSACQLLKSGNHPDLIIIKPEEQDRVIKIDQIRNITTELNNTSQQGGYKIIIIERAELLNIAASNSLLKTLEEPTTNVIIILTSHHPAALAATIRSRCQAITIKAPSLDQAHEWLKQNTINIPEADFKLALALAEHAPLKSLDILQKDALNKRIEFFHNLYALQNKEISAVQVAEKYLNWNLKYLVLIFMYITADIIKIKLIDSENITNQDQIKKLTQLAAKTDTNKLFIYQEGLLKLHQAIIKGINFNQQLITENLVITWNELYAS